MPAECDDCSTGCNKITKPGHCGCTVPDTDADVDRTTNCKDSCPYDANKTSPGACGGVILIPTQMAMGLMIAKTTVCMMLAWWALLPVLVVSQITMWLEMGPPDVKMISHVVLTRQAPVSMILVYQTMTWLKMGQVMAKLAVCMMLAKWVPAPVDVLLLTLTWMETAIPIELAICLTKTKTKKSHGSCGDSDHDTNAR